MYIKSSFSQSPKNVQPLAKVKSIYSALESETEVRTFRVCITYLQIKVVLKARYLQS